METTKAKVETDNTEKLVKLGRELAKRAIDLADSLADSHDLTECLKAFFASWYDINATGYIRGQGDEVILNAFARWIPFVLEVRGYSFKPVQVKEVPLEGEFVLDDRQLDKS